MSLCRSYTVANCDGACDVGNSYHHGSTFPGDEMSSACGGGGASFSVFFSRPIRQVHDVFGMALSTEFTHDNIRIDTYQ